VGDYVYQCDGDESENGFRLPSGAASVLSAKGGYYSFTTAGNTWYAASSGVTILAGQMVDYNAKLWPMGSGNLDVTVINNGNNLPISNARVDLLTYAGTHIVLTTDSEGKAIFQNVMETWPPVNLPADLYYKHNVLSHSLTTTHPSGVFSSDLNHPITDLQRNNTMPITIRLNQGGGT
jgi:hypothetical protein